MKEQYIAFTLALIFVVVQVERHKLTLQAIKDNAWDTFLPWIFIVCGLFVAEAVKAALVINGEFADSRLISVGTLTYSPEKYIIKIFLAAGMCILIGATLSYLSWAAASVKVVAEPSIRPWTHGAKVEWGPFRGAVSPPTTQTPFFFNIYEPNTGQLDAINVVRSYAWRLTNKEGQDDLPPVFGPVIS